MNPDRRRVAALAHPETLEGRQLLAASPPLAAEVAKLNLDTRAVHLDIARMQLTSHVTVAEAARLGTDINQSIAVTGPRLTTDLATLKADAATVRYNLLHSFMDGYQSDRGWTVEAKQIGDGLAALGHPISATQLDRLMTDLRAIARSGGVTSDEAHQLYDDDATVYADRAQIRTQHPRYWARAAAEGRATEPINDFETHLGGFVPGGRVTIRIV